MSKKTGILGGAFNPPHSGHILLAEKAIEAFGLDDIIFIPTGTPPHKAIKSGYPAEIRLLLIRLAVFTISPEELATFKPDLEQSNLWIEFHEYYRLQYPGKHRTNYRVSDYEIFRKTVSYTIDTVRVLQAEDPDRKIHILIGMDQAEVFHTWKNWRELSGLAEICVADRGNTKKDAVLKKSPFLRFFPFPKTDISSSEIRSRLQNGQSLENLVPPVIEKFLPLVEKFRKP